ncbi:hypothetical protein D9M71_644700 [compost metagenome]
MPGGNFGSLGFNTVAQIQLGSSLAVAIENHTPVTQIDSPAAVTLDQLDVVGNQQDGDPTLQQFFESVKAFELEGRITYCQSLIDDQDIGIDMRRDGKG